MKGRWASGEEQRERGGGRGERAGRDIMSGMGNSADCVVSFWIPPLTQWDSRCWVAAENFTFLNSFQTEAPVLTQGLSLNSSGSQKIDFLKAVWQQTTSKHACEYTAMRQRLWKRYKRESLSLWKTTVANKCTKNGGFEHLTVSSTITNLG